MGFIIVMGFIIWLIGWSVSYYLLSRVTIMYIIGLKSWDNFDRKICATVSLLSWVGVVIALLILTWFKLKLHLDPMDLENSFMNFLKRLEPERLSKG